jgi:hypothetical protein
MNEYVLFALMGPGNRLGIGALPAKESPLPFGSEIITRVCEPDLKMMLLWAKRRAKRGWSVEKIRAACE